MSREPLQEAIGRKLRSLRISKGFTQIDVGEAIGLSPEQYGRLERGICFPSIPTLIKLSQFHKLAVDELLGCSEPSDVGQTDPRVQRLADAVLALEPVERERFVSGFLTLIPPADSGPK